MAAEVLSTKHALGVVRTLNLICATSIPVVIGLVVLARWQGVYEDYMDYPNNQYVSISNCRLSDICVYEQVERQVPVPVRQSGRRWNNQVGELKPKCVVPRSRERL